MSAVHKNLSHLFQACDTIDNVDEEVYEQMSQCAAYVLEVNTQINLISSDNEFVCIEINDERRPSRFSE